MKKWGACLILPVFCSILMAGCASENFDISDEDEARVVNYAATVLEEHNASNTRTLATLTQKDLERIVRLDLAAAAAKNNVEEDGSEESGESEEAEEVSDELENSDSSSGEESSENTETENISIAEAIGLDGFDISYNGYEILDEYPNSEEEGVFTITPGSSEDSLLVVHFNVFNPNSETEHCDTLDLKPSFRLLINGQKHSILTTLLLNDLVTLDDDINSGENLDAVLIAEISDDKAANISSLGLIVKGDDGNREFSLE